MSTKISSDFPYTSQYVEVYGSKMHYVEQGLGDPILFIHGMPASSYVWRNVIPHLSSLGRCIALDLIGMGKSDKPDIEYSIFDHIRYVEKFIEQLNLTRITLIMHCWGSVIGFDYAMHNTDKCKALIFYEAFLRSTTDISLPLNAQIYSFDQEENIKHCQEDGTYYIDHILPNEMMRPLTYEERQHYREPFLSNEGGQVLCQYMKELPRTNKKSKVDALINAYSEKLTQSTIPKLMLYSVPGFITSMTTAMWAKENLPNLQIMDVGEELHYMQESDPDLMVNTMSIWLQSLG